MGKRKIKNPAKRTKPVGNHHSEPELSDDQVIEEIRKEKPIRDTKKIGSRRSEDLLQKNQQFEHVDVHSELLSENFVKRMEDFQEFYRKYLQLKIISSDQERNEEFERVMITLKKKMMQACKEVFKNDATSALTWADQTQKQIQEQIIHVEQAEANTRNALETSHTFSTQEIDEQVEGIKRKKAALVEKLSKLSEIRARTQEIALEDPEIVEE